MDFSLPGSFRKATFRGLYDELELHRAVLRTYTKSLFSWRKALSVSHDGRTLYDFARETPRNVERIHRELSGERFRFREGIELEYNFNGKRRRIYLFPWEERLVDLLLYRLLNRRFHGALSSRSFAYRHRGFGADACQHRVARELAALGRPVYFMKRDIAQYFPSIDHEVLLAALAQWIEPGDYLYELLLQRVRFLYHDGAEVRTAERGVPFGAAIACFLANFYLTPLDRALESVPGLSCYRYADDLLAFSGEREPVVEAGRRFDAVLAELKLGSKPTHHRNFRFAGGAACGESDDPLFEKVAAFRHLGLEFRSGGGIGLSRDKTRKIRNLFRFAFRRARRRFAALEDPEGRAALAVEISRRLIERGFRPVAIIDYYLKHVDDEEQLRRLDRWLAEEILAVAFRNGHRKGNFRALPFARLRAMGLPSLRHRRRLLRHGHLTSSFFVFRTERLIEEKRRRLPGMGAHRRPRRDRAPAGEPATQAFSPRLEAAADSGVVPPPS